MTYYALMIHDPMNISLSPYVAGIFKDRELAMAISNKYDKLHEEEEINYSWVDPVPFIENEEVAKIVILGEE